MQRAHLYRKETSQTSCVTCHAQAHAYLQPLVRILEELEAHIQKICKDCPTFRFTSNRAGFETHDKMAKGYVAPMKDCSSSQLACKALGEDKVFF